jgi:hypothetical protein
MKRIGILAVGVTMTLALGACDVIGIRGDGNVVTERRAISDFIEIRGSGGSTINWQSGPPSLSITTDKNLMQYVVTEVTGSTLRVRMRQKVSPTHHLIINVTTPKFQGASLSGAVNLDARAVTGPKFYVRASGASDITVDGAVDEFLADLTGATDLRARDLKAKTVQISSTGASSAKISVSDTLRVAITGAGDVDYYGNPKTIEKHVTGAGSIQHKD